MPRGKILLVDDDEGIRRSLTQGLLDRGYELIIASSGEEAVGRAMVDRPDVIVMDLDVPEMDGIDTCQELRRGCLAPILLLSGRRDAADVILGLGVGADYYFTKPLKFQQFYAHLDAAVRREIVYSARRCDSSLLKVKDLTLDLSAFELRRDGEVIALTNTEFKLIQALAQNVGRVITRSQLLDSVWDSRSDGIYSRTVDVHVGRIRKKLGDDHANPRYIATIAGLGYKMPNG